MSDHIKKLHLEYSKYRRKSLPEDQFSYIVKLYPALLVCMSDDALDNEEWESIALASKSLASEFASSTQQNVDVVAMSLKTEMRYLLDNIDKWKIKFLHALQHALVGNKLDQEFVLETMYLFANIAGGINDQEEKVIHELAARLEINA